MARTRNFSHRLDRIPRDVQKRLAKLISVAHDGWERVGDLSSIQNDLGLLELIRAEAAILELEDRKAARLELACRVADRAQPACLEADAAQVRAGAKAGLKKLDLVISVGDHDVSEGQDLGSFMCPT